MLILPNALMEDKVIMETSFFYINKNAIDTYYSQIKKKLVNSHEEIISKISKGGSNISLGPILSLFGLVGPDFKINGNVEKSVVNKKQYTISHQHKLASILKYQKATNSLSSIYSNTVAKLKPGSFVLFNLKFSLVEDDEEGVHILHSLNSIEKYRIYFSKKNMEPSIFAFLKHEVENADISGVGVALTNSDKYVTIRPISFGLNFFDLLEYTPTKL